MGVWGGRLPFAAVRYCLGQVTQAYLTVSVLVHDERRHVPTNGLQLTQAPFGALRSRAAILATSSMAAEADDLIQRPALLKLWVLCYRHVGEVMILFVCFVSGLAKARLYSDTVEER